MKTDFLRLSDLPASALPALLTSAHAHKAAPAHQNAQLMRGRTLMLMFEKPSTRTRLSFTAAMHQMGGQCLFVSSEDTQLSRGEPIADVARVAGTMMDALAIRTDSHKKLETFARHCQVPVINALSERFHPCQTLADLLTVEEEFGTLSELTVAWVGDANNSLNSWLEACALLNFSLRYACPQGYAPDPSLLAQAPRAQAVPSPLEAVDGAQVVSTDVWVSMNQEDEGERLRDFAGYQVNTALMSHADKGAILLHCLPAHRGLEVDEEILDADCSRVWSQAANRLPAQKALLQLLLDS